jgi:hypothetical protein
VEPDYRQGGGWIQLRPDSAEAGAIGPTRCRGRIVSTNPRWPKTDKAGWVEAGWGRGRIKPTDPRWPIGKDRAEADR